MTAVQRLQLLPPPGTTPAGQAVAAPGGGEQQVKPVVPARPVQRGLQDPRDSQELARRGGDTPPVERRTADRDWQSRQAEPDEANNRETTHAAAEAPAKRAAAGRRYGFSHLSSLPFLVQVLGQEGEQEGISAARPATPQTGLSRHRDAAQLGSDIYRKAGGEPEFLPETATFVRLVV